MIKYIKKIGYHFYIKYLNAVYLKKRKREGTLIDSTVVGYKNVSFEGENVVPDKCKFFGNVKIGYRTTLGSSNFFHGNITIGKYCQIGSNVGIHSSSHPISYLSTYVNKNLFGGELVNLKNNFQVQIGHDVWIGHGVIIVGHVKIGNGAILGAGTVVTKDVPPYSIVVGVPGRVIRKRFNENVISEIESLKWWDLSDSELNNIKNLFFKNYSESNSIYE
ncbi:MAG: CatB-related O-acetyltransferase [Algoriphagus sp.]|uniref:CatB-related O-acetyltransferase n=1 Tax=Algoriphagus sp. TaxID=1872435 RepID=UPI0017967D5C|nr:CatB-related O-acetyltransferase [Algoriphagus sp.]NVJ86764.1 CatB-related O-acetyltransferase [Algoriphagus sp.]